MQTLVERVEQRGDELALVDELGSWTWAELDVRLNRLVHALRGLGLALGGRCPGTATAGHLYLSAGMGRGVG